MLKIGRYGIAFGRTWLQTWVPTTVRHYLFFWFIKEARPHDVDKEQQFLIGTELEQDGRRFRYWKASQNLVGNRKQQASQEGGNSDEWLDEPNREEFEHAGLKCLILRQPELGQLNGYVAVPKGHPCYGKDYDGMPYEDLFPVEVHGGLTFSEEGDGDKRPEGWGFGFDCAHAWDLVPFISRVLPFQLEQTTYRNFQYVRRETKNLAEQLATLEFIDWEFCRVWPLLLPPGTARRMWIRASQERKGNSGDKASQGLMRQQKE